MASFFSLSFGVPRCFDANLIEIPVEIETPEHHYYHVKKLSKLSCMLIVFLFVADCVQYVSRKSNAVFTLYSLRSLQQEK